ncbi:hypothetical protein L2E82_27219 [Cichorium intybus]|uniref:Uncharacterized protein n=1 Tax=Cichorium intybus TaxID=13427 RepID=A0ACB9CSR8_CICIN|nr:hypothetical protein L2E82_27219 [Cichorium intybus]
MSFICGSFNDQKEDDFEVLWPYPPTPARKTRRHRFCCKRNKENPYSNRGLDKFEALLADLDQKKQKIFTQKGSEYISFVRFVYSNSNDVKPIIVKLRDPRKQDKDHHKQINVKDTKSSTLLRATTLDHHQNSEPPGAVTNGMIKAKDSQHVNPSIDRLKKMIRVDQWKFNMKRKLEEWWMPSYNLPLFVILVLFFLTFFGRSLAIICTSIAWYLIPSIDGTLENMATKPNKMIKNGHSKEPSENKMISSPKAFFSGPINVQQRHKMKKLMSF